jgi:hypothetical protein
MPAQIEVGIAQAWNSEEPRSALAGALLGVMNQQHGDAMASLQFAQIGEQRRDLSAGVLIEHRAVPSLPTLTLELVQNGHTLALQIVEPTAPSRPSSLPVDERIIVALTGIDRPLPFAELRARCRLRSATAYHRLDVLTSAGRIVKSPRRLLPCRPQWVPRTSTRSID